MRLLKRVLRKLYHLIAFLGLLLVFIPNANAEVSYFDTDCLVSRQYYGNSFYSLTPSTPQIQFKEFYQITHSYNGQVRSLWQLKPNSTLSLSDNKNYTFAFWISENTVSYGSNPNYNLGVSPLVILGEKSCSTRPVGYSSNDSPWNYQSLFYVECDFDNSMFYDNGAFNINTYYLQNQGYANVTSSVSKRIFYWSEDVSLADVQQTIQQENDKLVDATNDLNDTLNDNTVDSSDSTINELKNKIPTNSVISDLLLLPVRFLQNFVNALGSSCSSFPLGSLYGTNLFMPCINIQNYLGSGIWTTIDLIMSGFFIYALRKKFIQIYENLTNLKNGGNEVD